MSVILIGVLDGTLLADWCYRHLGVRLERVLFRSGHLSEVVGVELADGRRAVVKARPSDPRLVGCLAVQADLARAGFPCPVPLTTTTRVGALTVTAETEMPGGSVLPAEAGAAPFAVLLARLVRVRTRPRQCPPARAFTAVDRVGPPGCTIVAGP